MPSKLIQSYYRAWHAELERFLIRRLPSREVAEDLMQEAFIRLTRAQGPPPIRDPKAWLFRAARNLVVDHYRASARAPLAEQLSDATFHTADPAPTAEAVLLSREELDVVLLAIEDLPPRGREVFRLSRHDGLGYGEIAERLGISRNTVMVHMTRGLAHCKQRLNAHRSGERESE